MAVLSRAPGTATGLPINVGQITMQNLPYLQQTQSPLKYTPQMTGMMEQAYGLGLGGLANLAFNPIDQGDMAMNQLSAPNMPNMPSTRSLQSVQMPNVPNATFESMNFDPIEQQARAGFERTTIPTIAERFTNMGAGASGTGAFARTLGGAAAGLEENLASMKAQLLPQWEMQKAQYGLQRSALDQQRAHMEQAQDQASADLASRYAQMNLAYQQNAQNFALQKDQMMQQQQQQRTSQLLGLLGFSPPTMWGSPTTKMVPNPVGQAYTNQGNISGINYSGDPSSPIPANATPLQALPTLSRLGYSLPSSYLPKAYGAV